MTKLQALFNNIEIETNQDKIYIITYPDKSQFCITPQKVSTTDGKTLSSQESQKLYFDILRATFNIPETQKIQKIKEKIISPESFSLEIQTIQDNNKTNIEFQTNDKGTYIKRNSEIYKKENKNQFETTKNESSYILTPTQKEYSSESKTKEDLAGDKVHSDSSISLKRSISNNGKDITLEYKESAFDELEMDDIEDHTTIEISGDKISQKSTINHYDKKAHIETSYDLKSGKIKCSMKEIIYDAMHKTEFKQTLLTLFTHKKYPSTLTFDYRFKGELEIQNNGDSQYKVNHTTPDCAEEHFTLNNDLSKVNPEMLQEIEQMKEIAKKIAIVKNSQHNSEEANFAINPSLFDNEIDFSSLADKSDGLIVSSLAEKNSLHRNLIFTAYEAIRRIPLQLSKENSNLNS